LVNTELNNKNLNIIGYANWIIVILIFVYLFTMPSKIPHGIGIVLEYYLKLSLFPPLISIFWAVVVKKDLKSFNLIANVIFLILYVLVFIFSSFMSMQA